MREFVSAQLFADPQFRKPAIFAGSQTIQPCDFARASPPSMQPLKGASEPAAQARLLFRPSGIPAHFRPPRLLSVFPPTFGPLIPFRDKTKPCRAQKATYIAFRGCAKARRALYKPQNVHFVVLECYISRFSCTQPPLFVTSKSSCAIPRRLVRLARKESQRFLSSCRKGA